MRRGSLVGPILLIVIGAVFLANNLRPELPLIELTAQYWPFVLIGWGLLRVVEILYWAARSRPLPAAGISGGEWTLIVFLCLIGSGLFVARKFTAHWPHARITMRGLEVFGESFDYPVSARHKAGKTPRVVIENLRGNVRLTGADTEEIQVDGRTTIRAFQQPDADKAKEQCPLEVTSLGDRLIIRTNQDRVSGEQRVSSDLEITVPRGAVIEGRGRSGDFDISKVAGAVEIHSENAGVRLQEIGGNVRLELRSSDIVRAVNVAGTLDLQGRGRDVELENVEGQVTVNGSYSGEIMFRNLAKPLRMEGSRTELHAVAVPGQIRMALGDFHGEGLVGPVRLNTRSKDVRIGDCTESLEVTLERGDIELRPMKAPLPKMEVRTRSGRITLVIPEDAAFDVQAEVKQGEAANLYGEPLRQMAEGRGAWLRGASGQGPSIRLYADRGAITVTKSTGEPAPASRPPTRRLKVEQQ